MDTRIEKDSLGEIKVEADKLWGAATQRSIENFNIGTEKIPAELIEAALSLGLCTEQEFDRLVRPESMLSPF